MAFVTLYLTFKAASLDKLCPVMLGSPPADSTVVVLESIFTGSERYVVMYDNTKSMTLLRHGHAIVDGIYGSLEPLYSEHLALEATILLPQLSPVVGKKALVLSNGAAALPRRLFELGMNLTVVGLHPIARSLSQRHLRYPLHGVEHFDKLSHAMLVNGPLHELGRDGAFHQLLIGLFCRLL